MRGDIVDASRLVQQALLRWSCSTFESNVLPKSGADGKFGAETKRAVELFQIAEAIEADGIVGPMTLARLDNLVGTRTLAVLDRNNSDAETGTDGQAALRDPAFANVGPKHQPGLPPRPLPPSFFPIDSLQGKSWVDPNRSTGIIGQIFFETGSNQLDTEDFVELDKIAPAYIPVFNAPETPPMPFAYVGFADHRRFRPPGGNQALSEARASSVRTYVEQTLDASGNAEKTFPKYKPKQVGGGVDPRSNKVGTSASALKPFRRVDVLAPPAKLPVPSPGPEPKKPLSDHFRFKLLGGGGVGFGVGGSDSFFLRIEDLKNKRAARFAYGGLSIGLGTPASLSGDSDPITRTTSKPICLEHFEGFATHQQFQLQIGIGPSADQITLFGPTLNRGAQPVELVFLEAAGEGLGAQLAESAGNLQWDLSKRSKRC